MATTVAIGILSVVPAAWVGTPGLLKLPPGEVLEAENRQKPVRQVFHPMSTGSMKCLSKHYSKSLGHYSRTEWYKLTTILTLHQKKNLH